MRNFIYSLMTDKRESAIFSPFKGVLYLLSLIYGLVIFFRSLFYKFGIFKTSSVPIKVISVGNLTLGGTGKTPFVITLARLMDEEMNKEVGVLIRGYGWDEQAMLKKNLTDIPILVGEDRVRSSHRAIKLYGSDTAILDDGFQYWELKRDLDIVLIDSRNPFGNGRLFPRGTLRESKDAIIRADAVVFTKVNKLLFSIDAMKKDLKRIKEDLIFLEAVHRPKNLYDVKMRRDLNLDYLKGKRTILLSSIGDPEYFEETVKDLNAEVITHIKFADHHNYTKKDIDSIVRICDERKFDILLTTEKDAVKLSRLGLSFGDNPLMTLQIEMDITSGKESLVVRLHSLYNT